MKRPDPLRRSPAGVPYSSGPLPQAIDLGDGWAFPPRTHRRLNLFHSDVRIERLEQLRLKLAALLTSQERNIYGDLIEHLGDLIHDLELEQTD
jgi:hypothetical protein